MDSRDRRERRCIDGVKSRVNPSKKIAHTENAVFFGKLRGALIKFPKIGTCGKTMLAFAVNDARGSFRRERVNRSNKLFQFFQHREPNFVRWRTVEHQLDHALAPFPAKRFAGERLHALLPAAALLSSASAYMALISAANRALIASRRSLPITVTSPLSGVRFSESTVKLRICR